MTDPIVSRRVKDGTTVITCPKCETSLAVPRSASVPDWTAIMLAHIKEHNGKAKP